MPLYEYECDHCIKGYNSDIDALVAKLSKTNASKIMKKNSKLCYIEASDNKNHKLFFALGAKGISSIRRFKYTLENDKVLYLELKNYRFSELIYKKSEEKSLKCPLCKESAGVRRVFSTFKAIFDDKSKREPGPKDELRWHLEYKQQKDEEIKSEWVGQDYLNQYFQR